MSFKCTGQYSTVITRRSMMGSFFSLQIHEPRNKAFVFLSLRACLHGVGDPGLVRLVSFVFTLWGTQNKRNLPH